MVSRRRCKTERPEEAGEAEVDDFDMELSVQEDVSGLHIAVDDGRIDGVEVSEVKLLELFPVCPVNQEAVVKNGPTDDPTDSDHEVLGDPPYRFYASHRRLV
ncbi:hypothetical protein AXF42_Ash013495 [Apostasia shenzhenica]|uniref:Uncharacterized protein n=1 Tax=Apostasia shenzhenica TaxID=1088818 RepID=A0A2I0A4D0_9ASPA|nr:hypothetical protein AXF42_Ash013495 [Apostasia shenzhenica]